ncbi:ABC transporter permease [Paucibacter sp. DJ2R-2]|uniref:ABC transporter permease n=1 Tax=Paucibacter sp. DJ2R-2 TaxID=2893558 RepID=UPI0021E4388C|nr:ABC transporter permease [Paucibacter sp. DJ2R-2]MCV2418971.1 ABC transporter permease [Paucibacter sp. DJ4R-1]MCV2438074.1 ABC transporter permease [Paucibacter sp. DJ2R-2]
MRTWLATLAQTWRAALTDKGTLLMFIVAPVLYAFFYPWPYTTQELRRVPVAIVDLDHSNIARQIGRFTQASPRLDLRFVTASEAEARRALARREIEGYVLLPADMKREILRGQGVVLPVLADGAYFLINKVVLSGFGEVIGTVSAGAELRQLQARGAPKQQAALNRSPLNLSMVPLFNPTEGYGSYVVPAVAVLIIQQLLLMGSAMWVGTWFETRRSPEPLLGVWSARTAAFASLGLLSAAWFFGPVFRFFDYGYGGNVGAAALLLLPFCWGIAALGVALGALLADRERALQALLCSSLPMAFLSGFSWPREALPAALVTAGDFIPAVVGIQTFLRLNQMGATLAEVRPFAELLLLQALAYSVLAAGALSWRARRADPQPAKTSPAP